MKPSGGGEEVDFVTLALGWLRRVCDLLGVKAENVHEGELAAFLSYAVAYPRNFLPVIDTYSVKRYLLTHSFTHFSSMLCCNSQIWMKK